MRPLHEYNAPAKKMAWAGLRDACEALGIDLGRASVLLAYQDACEEGRFEENGWDEDTMEANEEDILSSIYDNWLSDYYTSPAEAAQNVAEDDAARKHFGTKKEEN